MEDIYKIVYGRSIVYHESKMFSIERLPSDDYVVSVLGSKHNLNLIEIEHFFYALDKNYGLGIEYFRDTKRFKGIELYDLIMFQLTTIFNN